MCGRGMGDTGRDSEGSRRGMMEHNGDMDHHDTGEEDL
jgi:hypothetical protein